MIQSLSTRPLSLLAIAATTVLYGLALGLSLFDVVVLTKVASFAAGLVLLTLSTVTTGLLIKPSEERITSLLVWGMLYPLFIAPLLTYLSHRYLATPISFPIVASIYTLPILIALAWHRTRSSFLSIKPSFSLSSLAWLIPFFLFLAIHILMTTSTPYFSDSDTYEFANQVDKIAELHSYKLFNNRPFFLILLSQLGLILNITSFVLLKYVTVFFFAITFLPLYLLIQEKPWQRFNKFNKILILFLPLSSPVLIAETDIIRAQTIALISLFFLLYFWTRALIYQDKSSFVWAFIAGFLGMFHHEVFILYLATTVLISPFVFRSYLAHRKLQFLGITLWTLFTIFLLIKDSNGYAFLIGELKNLTHQIIYNFQWNWWYIDNYITPNSLQVGWPGWSGAIRYYAYYYGPFLTLMTLLAIFTISFRVRFQDWRKGNRWLCLLPLMILSAILLAIAEVVPRLGIAFFVDRLRPYLTITLGALVITSFGVFSQTVKPYTVKILHAFIILGLLTGFAGAVYISYWKKSPFDRRDVEAAQYLRTHSDPNSLVITQGYNIPLVSYYAKRTPIKPYNKLFMSDAFEQNDLAYMKNPIAVSNVLFSETGKTTLSSLFQTFMENPADNALYNRLATMLVQYRDSVFIDFAKSGRSDSTKDYSDVYILYSSRVFKGVVLERDYILEDNFYGAKLDKFDTHPLVEKIYDKNGISIWKIRPN